jgi:hypothetical protein
MKTFSKMRRNGEACFATAGNPVYKGIIKPDSLK